MTSVTKGTSKGDGAENEGRPDDPTDGADDRAAGTPAEQARDTSPARSRPMWRPFGWEPTTPPLVLMTVAVVVVGVGCLFLWHDNSQDAAVQKARSDGLAAAQSSAKDLLSYNYRTLDYDLGKARAEMTPAMARSYDAYWKVFRPSVQKSQTQALTQIQTAGVTQASADHVEVLLFVKMISVNAAHKEPQVDTSWPRLEMKKIGKRWLVDGPRMTTAPAAGPAAAPSPAPSPKAQRPGPADTSSKGH